MKTTRLILDATQTECLRAAGVTFAVVVPGSYPDAGGKAVLHLVPIDKPTADRAIAVALKGVTGSTEGQTASTDTAHGN